MTDAPFTETHLVRLVSHAAALRHIGERSIADAIAAALVEIDRLTRRERVGLTEIDRLREVIHLALANKDRTHLGTVRSILADAVNAPEGAAMTDTPSDPIVQAAKAGWALAIERLRQAIRFSDRAPALAGAAGVALGRRVAQLAWTNLRTS